MAEEVRDSCKSLFLNMKYDKHTNEEGKKSGVNIEKTVGMKKISPDGRAIARAYSSLRVATPQAVD